MRPTHLTGGLQQPERRHAQPHAQPGVCAGKDSLREKLQFPVTLTATLNYKPLVSNTLANVNAFTAMCGSELG